jgi:hypothetical protein
MSHVWATLVAWRFTHTLGGYTTCMSYHERTAVH